ncbi:MAG: hypothetical protein HYU66_11590 [Armatimonadetes bacterium]|nr:hypothetical protein [Armatimonadota bacterium]
MTGSERWIAALQRGDDEAAAPWLERYRAFVAGRLQRARAARNWFWLDDVDDAAQEVLVRFLEAVHDGRFQYRDEEQLRGFLVRTAWFVAMRRKDQAAAEQPLTAVLGDEEAERVLEGFDLHAFAESAFDTWHRRDCLRRLYEAVERLPAARREVIRLTLLGLAPREIAPRMHRSANAVAVLKYHALADLAEDLERTDFEAVCGRFFLGDREG